MKVAWEDDADAQALVRRAARFEAGPPSVARARVWRKLQEQRGRDQERPARRRLGWAMFVAGASCAAAITFMLLPRDRGVTELTIASTTEAATIDLAGDGRVVAGPGTLARFERSGHDRAVTLTLEHGSLLAHVKPRGKQAPFVIQTPSFRARVVGTVLRVVARDDGTASIAVGHGAVEVTPNGQRPRLIRSGERWPTDATDAPAADELARMGADDLEGTGTAAFAPPARPVPQARLDCGQLHGEDAVACWLRIGDENDPVRAESALYQAGWIRMHEMHDAAFALGIWERERLRFPRGVLRDEVQTSIIDALVALRRTRAAEAEIADYLRVHPNGLRSSEMHFVRATLEHADDKSCRRARHDFDVALQRPSAPWAARALAARASCP